MSELRWDLKVEECAVWTRSDATKVLPLAQASSIVLPQTQPASANIGTAGLIRTYPLLTSTTIENKHGANLFELRNIADDATAAPSPESSPDLIHLLTSNDTPCDSEVPFIRNIISDAEAQILIPLDARIDTVKDQIRDLRATLAHLVHRRKEAAQHVRQHQSIISPVRKMPPELIWEIFASTVINNSELDNSGGNVPAPVTPWYLGQISRSWRHCALSCVNLWSAITVPTPALSEDGLLTGIAEQLLWSANAVLDGCADRR
ncbi:hypothetical protein DFH06DRAFT_1369593 [Mycena polygramma]|nr:hypothetical protein DFH06DRAFT_1369593 [Mycena polygramma]